MDNYYVYVYIDPRNLEEFYYGKGKGNRKEAHLMEEGDSAKTEIINAIKNEGLEPIVKVVARNLTENEALLVEATLIWKLGKNLANKYSGHFKDKFRPHNSLHLNLSGFDFENGVYYVNVGEGEHRCWEDCKEYGFLSAGQHPKYSDPIRKLEVGDVVVAYLSKFGYVGIGKVIQEAVPVKGFYVDKKLLREVELKQPKIFENSDNENSEFLVKVDWIRAEDKPNAKWKPKSKLFTTQQVRASLDNQPITLRYLESEFDIKFEDILNESIENKQILQQIKLMEDLEKKKDKYLGCLLGGAIGDALGAPIEFLSWEAIKSKYGDDGVKGFVEHPNGMGEFTDDTQMTLFTAEGLIRSLHRAADHGLYGAQGQITYYSYLRWLHTQGVEVKNKDRIRGFFEGWLINRKELFKNRAAGNTCLSALQHGEMLGVGNPINDSKGCGTVMRIAPVGLIYSRDFEDAFNIGIEISALTHGHPSGYLSGGLLAAIIFQIAQGIELQEAIKTGMEHLRKKENHQEVFRTVQQALFIHEANRGKDLKANEIEKLGQGWVAEEALAISLLCSLHYQNDFGKAVLKAVNHSGDSDSTGAITGNIVGLILGASKIPEEWKSNMLYSDIVEQIANDLATQIDEERGVATQEWALKYPPY